MNAVRQAVYFGEKEKKILKALLYFDIFNYPLTANEIVRFSSNPTDSSPDEFLSSLTSQKLIFKFQNFYSLQNDESLIQRRIKGNALAKKKMKAAARVSFLLSLFPFVRAVMISGSLSKDYMDENSDIDFFIVTEPNRLWITRTAVVLFRRIFLFNSLMYLCSNYFVDDQNLEIEEKNIFTAIELTTMKPMFGQSTIQKFRTSNQWVLSYLPNFVFEKKEIPDKNYLVKAFIEKMISSRAADQANTWLMNKTIKRWKKKYAHQIDASDFEIAFRSTKGISKSHPQFYQKKILKIYDQKIKDFEMKHGIDLTV